VAAAALMVFLARGVDVNPLDRIGQISGLAALQLRYALIAAVLLVLTVVTARVRWVAYAPLARRIAAAVAAGLFSGLVAGAVVIALRGTSWGLNSGYGDAGALTHWAHTLIDTGTMQADYPPGWIHAMAWYSQLTDTAPEYTLKVLQITVTALFGPLAYLSWRLLLSPVWALALGVVPAMVLIDPYKPYTNLMLVVMIPVLLALLRRLRRAGDTPWRGIVLSGIGSGLALGLVFLMYSGWFVWSAPGVLLAALVLFPWRTGPIKGLALIAIAGVVFAAVSFRHLVGLLLASGSVKDRYFYWDTWVEPTYIAMWRSDLPGTTGPWPPPGELAGVGLFTILALVGLAAAIAVARHRTAVIVLTSVFAGAWLLRFYFGSQMYAADAVQLWPRSTAELLYCLLLLTGFACYYGVRRFDAVDRVRAALSSPSTGIGVLAALFLLIASAGSSTGDRYMPRADNSPGLLAINAQMVKQLDGTCSAYGPTLAWGCFEMDDPRYRQALDELAEAGPKRGELPHKSPGG
jgi:galactan 5-O-arabinofuranosyltransferase